MSEETGTEKQSLTKRAATSIRKLFERMATAIARPFIFPIFRKLKHDSNPPIGFTSEFLLTDDQIEIESWSRITDAKLPTLLIFHGNAPTLRSYTPLLRELSRTDKFNILAIDYRGYGYSKGTPSEEGLYKDAEALLKHTLESKKIPAKNIVFFGESLGSGVAVEMIKRHPECRGAILAAPYSSIASFYPEEIRSLPHDRFNSLEKIKNIPNKVLILHGGQDSVIPAWHGYRLKIAGPNTEIVELPKEKHSIDPRLITETIVAKLPSFKAPEKTKEATKTEPSDRWKNYVTEKTKEANPQRAA